MSSQNKFRVIHPVVAVNKPGLPTTVKEGSLWKSARSVPCIAGEIETIVAGEKFNVHMTEWWSGDGVDASIDGPGTRHHLSLPYEAWALVGSMIFDMSGPEDWLVDTDRINEQIENNAALKNAWDDLIKARDSFNTIRQLVEKGKK